MCQSGKFVLSCLDVQTSTRLAKCPDLFVYRSRLAKVPAWIGLSVVAMKQTLLKINPNPEGTETIFTYYRRNSVSILTEVSELCERMSSCTCFRAKLTTGTACNKHFSQDTSQKTIDYNSRWSCTSLMDQKLRTWLVAEYTQIGPTNHKFCFFAKDSDVSSITTAKWGIQVAMCFSALS